MSMKLRDLIRAVRACKTAAEERAMITKECALIRTAFRDESSEFRHRNVAKLLFVHMLGYPTHFGQMECVKLIASTKFAEKRIGYLALMLLLDERAELLTLVVNSLQQDLRNKNQYVAGLALATLGNISSVEMVRDLSKDLEMCMQSTNTYVQKKAALCAIRCFHKAPELIPDFLPRIANLLNDKSHSVLLCGLTLMIEVCKLDESLIPRFTRMVPGLVKLLRKLVMSSYTPDYDVGGVSDPFLQAKILHLLRVLGRGDPAASESMNSLLAQVATNTDSNKNAGNAILYETVQTIMSVEAESGLRVLAVNILGRFLINKDNNIRYVALQTLCNVVHDDTSAVQRHKGTIVDCLKDPDVSIRKRALVLVNELVNEENVRYLTGELLNYLAVADDETKADLCDRIGKVAAKFAPSRRWHIDTLTKVLSLAGSSDESGIDASLLILISQTPELFSYIAHKLYALVEEDSSHLPLIHVAVWCIGEFGELLLMPPTEPVTDPEDASNSTGPPGRARTETEVVNLLSKLMWLHNATASTKSRALCSLLKLTARFSSPAELLRIRSILGSFSTSVDMDLQQRSVEYRGVTEPSLEAIRLTLLERMPPVDASALHNPRDSADMKHDTAMQVSAGLAVPVAVPAAGGPGRAAAIPAAGAPGGAGALLPDLDDLFAAPVAPPRSGGAGGPSTAPAPAPASSSFLDDIFGGGPTAAPVAPPPAPVYAAPSHVESLLGGMSSMGFGGPAAPAPMADPMAALFGSGPVAHVPPPAPTAGLGGLGAVPPLVAFDQGGLRVVFEFRKPQGSDHGDTDILASFTNASHQPFTNFQFQVAVPKYIKSTIDTASSTTIPPGNSGTVTQVLHLQNSAQGQKPIMLKVKLVYNAGAVPVTEQVSVAGIPPTL